MEASQVGWRIPIEQIEILALIGNGAFGKVSKGRYNSEIVAVKQLHPQRFSEEAKASFRNEAKLMKELGHPRVLIYRGFFENDQDIGIVMEFMENGSLLDAIETKEQFDNDAIATIAYDIASGLNYLHLKDILHHDLKPANVFLDRYNRAKVGDFGLSVIKSESSTKVANSAAGTMAYLGPECFGRGAKYVKKSDVYAYAMVLWEVISWEVAYKDIDPYNISVCVRDGERLPIPEEDFGLGTLIETCWQQNMDSRLNFTEILLKVEPILPEVANPVLAGPHGSQSKGSKVPTSAGSNGSGILIRAPPSSPSAANEESNSTNQPISKLPAFVPAASSEVYSTKEVSSLNAEATKAGNLKQELPLQQMSNSTPIPMSGLPLQNMKHKVRISPTLSAGQPLQPQQLGTNQMGNASPMQNAAHMYNHSPHNPFAYPVAGIGPITALQPNLNRNSGTFTGSTTGSYQHSMTGQPPLKRDSLTSNYQSLTGQPWVYGQNHNPNVGHSNSMYPSVGPGKIILLDSSSLSSGVFVYQNASSPNSSVLSRDQTAVRHSFVAPNEKVGDASKSFFDKSKKVWIMVLAMVLIVLIAVGFGLFFGLQKKSSTGNFDYSKVTVSSLDVPSLAYPRGITFDQNGDLIFTDSAAYTINRLSKSGTVTTIAGSTVGFADGPSRQARFNATQCVIRGSDNNFYVVDTFNDRIRKIDMQQNLVTTIVGNGIYTSRDGIGNDTSIMRPQSLSLEKNGDILISEYWGHRIRRVTPQGVVSTVTGRGQGYSDGPVDQAEFNNPISTATAENGDILIMDQSNYVIRKLSNGVVSTVVGLNVQGFQDGIGSAVRFQYPYDIVPHRDGNFILIDGERIRLLKPNYEVVTLAGSTPGFADGSGKEALFNGLMRLLVEDNGNILVTDRLNSRIRRISFG